MAPKPGMPVPAIIKCTSKWCKGNPDTPGLDATEVRALHSQAHYIRHSTALAAPLLQMLQRSQLQVKSGLQQRGQQGQQQQEEQEEEGVEGVSILATQQDRIEQEQLLQKWVQDWEQQEGRLVAQLVPKLCQAGHDPPKANWLAHQAVHVHI
jgi:hypothetical protein